MSGVFLTLHAAGSKAPVTINMDKVVWVTTSDDRDGAAVLHFEAGAPKTTLVVTETQTVIADRLWYARQTRVEVLR